MGNLIKSEFYKLTRSGTFRVLFSIPFISAIVLSLILNLSMKDTLSFNLGNEFSFISDSGEIGRSLNQITLFKLTVIKNLPTLILIMCILAGFFISNDFTTGVIRNTILSGTSRTKIFFGKLAVYILGLIIITGIFPVVVTVMGTMLFDFEGRTHNSIFLYIGRSTLLYLLHFIAISSIFMLVTVILEDSGKVISTTLLAFLLLTVGYKSLDHIPLVSTFYEYSVFNQISYVFTKRLTPGEILVSIITGITTFIIFTFTAKVLFQKKEIK